MKLSHRQKLLLAYATAWPVLYILLFLAAGIALVVFQPRFDASGSPLLVALFAVHLLTMIVWLVTTVIYAVHIAKNRALVRRDRVLWYVALVFGSVVTCALYFASQVWPDARRADKTAVPNLRRPS